MFKKFLSAIILAFAFLFLNVSFNSVNINAEETIYENVGYGSTYWGEFVYLDDFNEEDYGKE